MSELEDMIGKILGDPGEMEKISQLASELFGGSDGAGEKKAEPDFGKMLGGLMKSSSAGSDKAALVAALGPYLKPERQRKLEKALKISRLAGLAGLAMNEMGEGNV